MSGSKQVQRMGRLVTGMVMAAALAGCLDEGSVSGPEPIAAWEATLQSTPVRPSITGQAAVILQRTRTEVGIGLEDLVAETTLSWGLFEGSCADPGGRVGEADQYEPLGAENLDATAFLTVRISENGAYHISVSDASTAERRSCGNLQRVDL